MRFHLLSLLAPAELRVIVRLLCGQALCGQVRLCYFVWNCVRQQEMSLVWDVVQGSHASLKAGCRRCVVVK